MHIPRGLFVVAAAAVAGTSGLVGASPAHATPAAMVYAAPSGIGTQCTLAAPCSITTAMTSAAAGDEVLVESGVYYVSTALADTAKISIVGQAGGAPPEIIGTGVEVFSLVYGSDLSHLTLVGTDGGGFLDSGGSVDHVTAVANGMYQSGCAVLNGTLSDSVCLSTGSGGSGFFIDAGGGSDPTSTTVLRGDTLEATGSLSYGLYALNSDGLTTTINAKNCIFGGLSDDIEAIGSATAGTIVKTTHSDYSAVEVDPGAGVASVTPLKGALSKAPSFINAAAGNFHEKASSVTVNAGATDPASDKDLAGNPRTLGSKPDVGAYELPIKPAVGKHTTKKLTSDSIVISGKVNPERLKTTVRLFATYKSTSIYSKPVRLSAVQASKSVKLSVAGLRRGTAFKVSIVATSTAGTTSTKVGTLHTG